MILETCRTVNINGMEFEWGSDEITHEQICMLAQQPEWASVVYSGPKTGDSRRSGITSKGQTLKLEDGMRIDAIVTGNA